MSGGDVINCCSDPLSLTSLALATHPLYFRCLKFSRGIAAGSVFATGGDDKLVKLWRVGRGSGALNSMGGNASSVVGLCFSPNSEQLLSASEGGSLKIFDLAEGRVCRSLNGHLAKVREWRFVGFVGGWGGWGTGGSVGMDGGLGALKGARHNSKYFLY